MYILDLIQQKAKSSISCFEDIKLSEEELDNLKIVSYSKQNLQKNINIAFKQFNITSRYQLNPNYDTIVGYIIYLAEELDVSLNTAHVKDFVLNVTPIEKFGICSFTYLWSLKFLIHQGYTDPEFWEALYITTNEKCKYLCKLALAAYNKSLLTEEYIKDLLKHNNSRCVIHDLQTLNITDEAFVVGLLDNIKKENGELYTKIKNDFAEEENDT